MAKRLWMSQLNMLILKWWPCLINTDNVICRKMDGSHHILNCVCVIVNCVLRWMVNEDEVLIITRKVRPDTNTRDVHDTSE